MRILGRTTDNRINNYDFCFLGFLALPFDFPFGAHKWPAAASITTPARLDGTASAPVRLDPTSASMAIRLDGTATTE